MMNQSFSISFVLKYAKLNKFLIKVEQPLGYVKEADKWKKIRSRQFYMVSSQHLLL